MSGNTALINMPRTMDGVRRRLLSDIPPRLGEYRVFEGKKLASPMCPIPPGLNITRLRAVLYHKLCAETTTYRASFSEYCHEEEQTFVPFDQLVQGFWRRGGKALDTSNEQEHEYQQEEKQAIKTSVEQLLKMENDLIAYEDFHLPVGIIPSKPKLGPIYVIQLKKPYNSVEVPAKENGFTAWYKFEYPDAYLKAVPRSSHLTVAQLRNQGLGNIGLKPRIFWRPGTLPSEPDLDNDFANFWIESLEEFEAHKLNTQMDVALLEYHSPKSSKEGSSYVEEQEDHQTDAEKSNFAVNDDEESSSNAANLQDFEHEDRPGNNESSSLVYGEDESSSHEYISDSDIADVDINSQHTHHHVEQPQIHCYYCHYSRQELPSDLFSVENSENDRDSSLVRNAPLANANVPPTPVSNKKRSHADMLKNNNAFKPSQIYGSSKITWSGKSARRSPSPPPSEETDSDDSDCFEPTTSRKQKRSTKRPAKPKPKTKALTRGRRTSKFAGPPLRQDSDLETDSQDHQMPSLSKRARKSIPEPKASSHQDSEELSSDIDEDDYMPSPTKRARKSTPQTKSLSQHEFDDFASDIDGFNDFKNPSPRQEAHSDSEAENDDFEGSPPPKKARKSTSQPKAPTDEPLLPGGWSQTEHDTAEAILRARRALEASNPDIPRFRDERLFKHVSEELAISGISRQFGSVKNYWNRYGRTRSGFEERIGKAAGASLVTSAQKKKGTAIPRVKKEKKDEKEPKSKC